MYLFIDTETTGVNRSCDRVVQVAWVRADAAEQVVLEKKHIIRPDGFSIPAGAVAIHGISTERANREGAPIADVLSELARDAKGVECVVAHNVSFDLAFLQREFSKARRKYPLDGVPSICTMRSSTSYCRFSKTSGSGFKWPKLTELHFYLFNRDFGNAHDAGADVNACMRCFFELVKRGVISAPMPKRTPATPISPPPEQRSSDFARTTQRQVAEPLQPTRPAIPNRVAPALPKLTAELAKVRAQLEAEQARVAELQKRIDYLESWEGLFAQAIQSDDVEWRKAVASNPRCPIDTLDELADFEDEERELDVLISLASNPSNTSYVFNRLQGWCESASWYVIYERTRIGFDENVEILEKLPRTITSNPSCPTVLLEYFKTHAEEEQVGIAAARAIQAGAEFTNSTADAEMLSDKLAELPSATAEAILDRYPLAKDAVER